MAMPSASTFAFLLMVSLTLLSSNVSRAQTTPIPLQPHKIQYALQVEREAIARKDSNKLAEAYYLYGKTYESAGAFITAQRYFLNSLHILERRGDSYELGRLYLRLATTEWVARRHKARLQFLYQASGVFQRTNSDRGKSQAYNALSEYYATDWSDGGKRINAPRPIRDSALYYAKKGEYLLLKRNDSLEIAGVKQSIAHQYRVRDARLALPYFQAALGIYQQHKKYGNIVSVFLDLSSTYLQLGEIDRAYQPLNQAQKLISEKKLKVYYIQVQLEDGYMNYYQAAGNWKQAFLHSQRLLQLERSTFEANRDGALSRLSVEYETEKKEAQLKQQQKELALRAENLRNQQRFLLAMGALLLVTIGMSIVFFRLYRKNQRISRRNAELVKEQNHRVKNNLQVVSSLLSLQSNRLADAVAQKAVEESQLRVETMAILHRKLYDGDGLVVVNLPEFISELVERVLQTFGYGFVIPQLDLSPIDLSADHALPVGLIINELTTNACKYAFPDNADPVFRVATKQTQHQIELIVSDNGPGFKGKPLPDPTTNRPKSFGLRLIHMQVEQLRGTYRFYADNSTGTTFTMSFSV